MNIIGNILHPLLFLSRQKWKKESAKLKNCGKNIIMGYNFIIQGPEYISIGDNVICYNNCNISAQVKYRGCLTGYEPCIIIGNNVVMYDNSFISCLNKVYIGDGCLLGINVYISDNFHGKNSIEEMVVQPYERKLYSKGPVIIGKNVWIGRNACIMPNVTIGDYAVIGANSVVTHDIPSYAIAAGCPAKVIKMIK